MNWIVWIVENLTVITHVPCQHWKKSKQLHLWAHCDTTSHKRKMAVGNQVGFKRNANICCVAIAPHKKTDAYKQDVVQDVVPPLNLFRKIQLSKHGDMLAIECQHVSPHMKNKRWCLAVVIVLEWDLYFPPQQEASEFVCEILRSRLIRHSGVWKRVKWLRRLSTKQTHNQLIHGSNLFYSYSFDSDALSTVCCWPLRDCAPPVWFTAENETERTCHTYIRLQTTLFLYMRGASTEGKRCDRSWRPTKHLESSLVITTHTHTTRPNVNRHCGCAPAV